MSSLFNWGLRSLDDTAKRFFGPGLPCYLRWEVIDPDSPANANLSAVGALGFQVSVSGNQSGVQDYLIDPPPEVTEVSLHNIGLNAARLRFGARKFVISHTWVLSRMAQMQYTDPLQVFADSPVVGLFYDGRIFSLESITHEDLGGQPMWWTVIGNAMEVQSPQPLSS